MIAETLANVELLLAQLEAGVRVPDNQRAVVRELFVQSQRQREMLAAALRLEELAAGAKVTLSGCGHGAVATT